MKTDANAPDSKPVAKWERAGVIDEARGYSDGYRCTNCQNEVHLNTMTRDCDYRFCPYCGAEMRGDEKE